MTTHKETLKLAQEVIQMLGAPSPLHFSKEEIIKWQECNAAIATALAQPEQEPVAWIDSDGKTISAVELLSQPDWVKTLWEDAEPLCTTPPQRKPLTEQFVMDSTRELSTDVRWPSTFIDVWRLCEAAHGINE